MFFFFKLVSFSRKILNFIIRMIKFFLFNCRLSRNTNIGEKVKVGLETWKYNINKQMSTK